MPAKLDLIGQRFGRLVVIDTAPNKGRRTQWKCICDCGKEYIGLTDSLRSGKLQSCGCLRAETARENGLTQLNDLTGQKFGKLTVVKYAGSDRNRGVWECECSCGTPIIVNQMELQRGDTLSCGCLRSSFGEQAIETILKENKITYTKEYSFQDLVSNKNVPLRFDFAIFENNILKCLIEYDGEQHYLNKTDGVWTDTLEVRQQRDKVKNNYCLNHNIPLYRIPYWEKNNISLDLIFSETNLVKNI